MKSLPLPNASGLTFSIVIPVWNGAAHLAQCLEALEASTRKPDEIVVVDDGSDDDSVAIARAHGSVSLGDPPARRCVRAGGRLRPRATWVGYLPAAR